MALRAQQFRHVMALFKRLGNIFRSYVGDLSLDGLPFGQNERLHEPPEESASGRRPAETPSDPESLKMREYYANLEIPEGSSFEEIRAAYRRMLKKYHPDVYHQSPEKRQIAEKISQQMNEAYRFFENKFNKGELT